MSNKGDCIKTPATPGLLTRRYGKKGLVMLFGPFFGHFLVCNSELSHFWYELKKKIPLFQNNYG